MNERIKKERIWNEGRKNQRTKNVTEERKDVSSVDRRKEKKKGMKKRKEGIKKGRK